MNIVLYLDTPEMKESLKMKMTISLKTMQHWMHVMDYQWSKYLTGQCITPMTGTRSVGSTTSSVQCHMQKGRGFTYGGCLNFSILCMVVLPGWIPAGTGVV